jgi:7-cyano-7-deazaguanine reductase
VLTPIAHDRRHPAIDVTIDATIDATIDPMIDIAEHAPMVRPTAPGRPGPNGPTIEDAGCRRPRPPAVPPGDSSLAVMELTVLGSAVRHPIDHVEVFPAPDHVTLVTFTTDEVASLCPVTAQPDLSRVVIEYVPAAACVESKSLKLYLWSFRDRAVFAEQMAADIAGEIMATAAPHRVKVVLTQRPRGGIELQAVAELPG